MTIFLVKTKVKVSSTPPPLGRSFFYTQINLDLILLLYHGELTVIILKSGVKIICKRDNDSKYMIHLNLFT